MKIELSLLDNGLDYIIAGLEPATNIGKSKYNDLKWKYSVLNVFSGIELILKERLRQEHWSLIFEDIGNANEPKLLLGDFVSVNHSELVKRLKGICNITINDEPINNLRKLRNRFEHFEVKITTLECKETIAEAVRELILFWNKYILPKVSIEQTEKFNFIKSMVFEFDVYVNNMIQKHNSIIDSILKNNAGIKVHCKECFNNSFIIYKDANKECQCFVCENKIAKQEYLIKIREQENEERVSEFMSDFNIYDKKCPNCQNETRIKISPWYFSVSKEHQSDYYFCLNCLYYETSSDIWKREFDKEVAELREKHTEAEVIEIIKDRLKKIK